MKMVSSSNAEDCLEIKQADKFFTRIMSKETSMANSSCRVYYGGASGSVPFTWESTPGTPKHTLSPDTSIPPLTPPPSFYSSPKLKSKSMHKSNLFNATILLPRLMSKKTRHVSHSSSVSSNTSSSSSSNWSSWSSSHSSPAKSKSSKLRKHPFLGCSRSPILDGVDDDDYIGLPTCELCYGGTSEAGDVVRGCYIMENMKSVFLSIVGHGHGSSKPNY